MSIVFSLLYISFQNVTAEATSVHSVYDTFNYELSGAMGNRDGWSISTGSNYGSVIIEKINENGFLNGYMKLTDTHWVANDDNKGVRAVKSFAPQSGKVNTAIKFKYVSSVDQYNSFEICMNGKDTGGAIKNIMKFVVYSDGKMGVDCGGVINYLPASDGSVKIVSGNSYILNVMINTSSGTFDMYIQSDGFAGFSGDPIPGKFNANNKTYFFTGKPFNQSGAVNVDNIDIATYKYRGSYYIDYVSSTQYPEPQPSHPRLYYKSSDVAAIKQRINKTGSPAENVWYSLIYKSNLYTVADMILPTPPTGGTNYINSATTSANSLEKRKCIEDNAVRYLLYGDTALGDKAVNMALNFMNTVVCNGTSGQLVFYEYSDILNMGAEVYDWCYDRISPAQKATFLSNFERLSNLTEMGWPPKQPLGALVGHGSGPEFLQTSLNVGIALYGDDNLMYDVASSAIMREFVEPREFWTASGMQHQGSDYGNARYEAEMYATWMFDRIGYPNLFGENQGTVPYRWLYEYRPDGQTLRDGDSVRSRWKLGSYWSAVKPFMLAASYFKDPYIQGEFSRQYTTTQRGFNAPLEILLGNLNDTGLPKSTLPLTRYFDDPSAAMIARTGWSEGSTSKTVVADMKIGGYQYNNHQHLDAGSFEIYYKGALAIDSGVYESSTAGYGSSHDLNYNKRTIAHNSMLIYKPDETFRFFGTALDNDGGQRWPGGTPAAEPSLQEDLLEPANGHKVAQVLAHQFGPDLNAPEFSHIKGDLTSAYASSKISNYKRSFVFLNFKDNLHPAAIVVFDKVNSTNASYKKHWLLHSIEQPIVNGNTVTINNTKNGNNGRLINTALLPAQINTIVEGGTGHEFEVFGTNYPNPPDNPTTTCDESGAWKVMISPSTDQTDDTFLNVLQVQDNIGGATPLNPEQVDSTLMVGTKIFDRVVMFSKSGEKLNSEISFNSGGTGTLKYVVTDLEAGIWNISNQGYNGSFQVTQEGSVLYFTGQAGVTTLSKSPLQVSITYPDASTIVANAILTNELYSPSVKPIVIAALYEKYNDKMVLKAVQYQNQSTINYGEFTEYSFTMQRPENIYTVYIQLMAWDQLNAMVPLSSKFACDISNYEASGSNPIIYEKVNIASVNASSWEAASGNIPENTIDGNLATRWSAQGLGEWIKYDLGSEYPVGEVDIAWYNGDKRISYFDIMTSIDGASWTQVFSGESSGTTSGIEKIKFSKANARYVKLIGYASNSGTLWNSVTEVEVYKAL